MQITSLTRWFEDRYLATIILVFMSIQFVAIEGTDISIPKVAMMAIMPLVFATKVPYMSKAVMYGLAFFAVTVGICFMNFSNIRYSTFIYTALFLITFMVYYNLVWIKGCLSIEYFLKVIIYLIYAYAICLILQQFFIITGIRTFSIINLNGVHWYTIFRLPSLAIEPSHAARLMTVFFYAFLKCTEYMHGSPMALSELYIQYKWVLFSFLYVMICLGSGTAFIGLAILSLYFFRGKYFIVAVSIILSVYFIIPLIDYEPLNRVLAVIDAASTGDTEVVTSVDNSAASRVNILLDTFSKLDLSDTQTWIGHGIDSSNKYAIVPGIYQFGLISYIFKLFFFFTCCFTSVLSLETLMFIILFGMNIGNIAYGWSALMVFTTLKYYKNSLSYPHPHTDDLLYS